MASFLGCKKDVPAPDEPREEEESAIEAPLNRCTRLGEPFVIGKNDAFGGGEEPNLFLPFAAEVGQAAVMDGGFAVGASFERDEKRVIGLVRMKTEGRGGELIELAESGGDIGPPHLAARGSRWVAAFIEPGPGGRSIRLASAPNGEVVVGASFDEKRDESLALDLALGAGRGLLAWDEEAEGGGRVVVSAFDPETLSKVGEPREVTAPGTDAESPRLIAHSNGFWLAYIRTSSDDAPAIAERYVTEQIGFRSIELISLDEDGNPQGSPRAITPREGHVAAFDIEALPGGEGLVFVWREDDGPSGSSGGRVKSLAFRNSEAEELEEPTILEEERVGGGVPGIVGHWLAISDASDITRIGRLSKALELDGPLAAESAIENGQVLAAHGDVLFVAQPRGKAIEVFSVQCGGE